MVEEPNRKIVLTGRQRDIQPDRHTDNHTYKQTYTHSERQTDFLTGWQTAWSTARKRLRQPERPACKAARQSDIKMARRPVRQMDRCRDRQRHLWSDICILTYWSVTNAVYVLTEGQTDKQTDGPPDRRTARQTGRQAVRQRQTDCQTDRGRQKTVSQTNTLPDRQAHRGRHWQTQDILKFHI